MSDFSENIPPGAFSGDVYILCLTESQKHADN
jgi:hypothetical protein